MVSVVTLPSQTLSQKWHVDVTDTQGVPCFKVTLNSQ